jgi:predicted acetyltransferase
VRVAAEGLVGVELLIDSDTTVVQFYALTSAIRGSGRRIVAAVVSATPEDWHLAVVSDWSRGFWRRMAKDYPRLRVA